MKSLTSYIHAQHNDEMEYCYHEYCEGSYFAYRQIAQKCRKYHLTHVYDIGCCYPFQAQWFTEQGIAYTGIEQESHDAIPGVSVIHRRYPFPIATDKHSAAVSLLCVGFQLDTKDVWEQIAQDFPFYIGMGQPPKGLLEQQEVFTVEGVPIAVWKSLRRK